MSCLFITLGPGEGKVFLEQGVSSFFNDLHNTEPEGGGEQILTKRSAQPSFFNSACTTATGVFDRLTEARS